MDLLLVGNKASIPGGSGGIGKASTRQFSIEDVDCSIYLSF